MSKSNDNDREFGNFHVDSKEGTVAICWYVTIISKSFTLT